MTATRRITDTLILLAGIAVLWQVLHQVAGSTALSGPVPTLAYLGRLVTTSRFAENAAATAQAFAMAVALAYAAGLALGVWLGASRLSGEVGEPILIALNAMPKIVLYPIFLLVLGLSIWGKVTFGALHGLLPVAILTMHAVRNVPRTYLKAAKTLHLSPRQEVLTVILPAALPEVVAALRIGFTVTLLGVLISEMFAAQTGLGAMIFNDIASVQTTELIAVALVLIAFAAAANAVILTLEHAVSRRATAARP
jgi:NitT/TauT family transport system permease protein